MWIDSASHRAQNPSSKDAEHLITYLSIYIRYMVPNRHSLILVDFYLSSPCFTALFLPVVSPKLRITYTAYDISSSSQLIGNILYKVLFKSQFII